jgi:hypothetical protein
MADARITELSTQTGANLVDADLLVMVDVSDTTMAATGTDVQVTRGQFFQHVGAIESDCVTNGSTGATETLDTSTASVFDMTMDQACEFTFGSPAPSGDNSTFMLILRGAFTPTFPASVDWHAATPPTYATPSVYIFTTVDAGTTWLGQLVGSAFG